jgi:penicillin amidase
MHALLLTLALALQPAPIQRDSYGVPLVTAANEREAFFHFGRAVAEDRLWQMELSRRMARGRLAEVLGTPGVASDRNVARTGYTDDEVQRQFDLMPARVKALFREYARGVSDVIASRKDSGTLPPGYTQNGIEPEPWTVVDSAAIAINLLRQFGRGGAGELRNYALYLYLQGQPCKDKVLDVVDDLAWQNDPDSVPTVRAEDDPLGNDHPVFPTVSRAQTEAHVKSLPPTNLLELFPAIQLATGEASDLIAEELSLPYKMGSYAVVVAPQRSRTGYPLLLSAPQMGHTDPSVVHEVAIDCPTIKVAGIDVPGVPIVAIGNTPWMAWGLTSGVADIEDVFYSPIVDDATYKYGNEDRKFVRFTREIKVKGGDPVSVEVLRTHHGPVMLNSRIGKCVYSVQSSFWNRELNGISALIELYSAKDARAIEAAISRVPVTFNFFFATTRGEYGFRYAGLVPYRAKALDPRFPALSRPENDWTGFVSASTMPYVSSTKSGVIANWNNKPATWWPNFDTPVWGSPFRNEVLLAAVPAGKLGRFELERAAWTIARRDSETSGALIEDFRALLTGPLDGNPLPRYLGAFDGWNVEGSVGALIYDEAVSQLRRELFQPSIGTLVQPAIFEQVVQPSVILKALRGETKYDFLNGRRVPDVVSAALAGTMATLAMAHGEDPAAWSFRPGRIALRTGAPIPYNNRGTYIQITELAPVPFARSVASPGVAETGPHAADQADLARAWTYKPVWRIQPD